MPEDFSLAGGEMQFVQIPQKPQTKKINHWSDADNKKLIAMYPINTNQYLSEYFGRTKGSIIARAFKLRLKKDQNWLIAQAQKGWFKPGQEPIYKTPKGVHLSPKTEFKKGHKPANTKFNGAITIRYDGFDENRKPYYHIRLGKAKWEYLHRHIYRQIHGEIPKYHLIRFIDGNTLNTDIDNLMCITRAQNAQLNQNRRKAAQTLKATNQAKKEEITPKK